MKIWSAVLRRLAIAHVSLVAALTMRLLWIYFAQIGTPEQHWQFVHYGLVAFAHAIFPILVVGTAVFYFQNVIKPPPGRFTELQRDAISFTVFFGVMALLSTLVAPQFSFPRQTWLVAWFAALVISTGIAISRTIDPGLRQRLVYNRTYYFLIDAMVVTLATAAAYAVRFDGIPPEPFATQFLLVLPYVVLIYVGINFVWGVYNFLWRFISLGESLIIAQSVASAAFFLVLLRILVLERYAALRVPYGVLLIQPVLAYSALLGARVLRRLEHAYWTSARKRTTETVSGKRVLLVGAGQAGQMLVRDLQHGSRAYFKITGFLDDDIQKRGRTISGIRVLGTSRDLSRIAKEQKVDEVILCMPTAAKEVLRRIIGDCRALNVKTLTVPSLSEIILGKVAVGQLRLVKMEDLLGRASVEHPSGDKQLSELYRNRTILITGAGGSIGSELARQLKDFEPARLILLDKDENSLYEIGLELRETYHGELFEVVGNVRAFSRMETIFTRWKPEVVFHAAAYKHVPMMEHHPPEAILNNVIGTRNVVDLSIACNVRSFVLISTDKAVNPTSIMGATKRLAELIVQGTARSETDGRFCSVRFGNVLGSRASVVPLFQKRIAQGKSIQITHPEMRRYFMTIPEAVQLVIQAGSLGQRGEIFVLDMGDPVRIVDMARELIELSGLVPDQDIPIEFTGIRPGEKLYEELLIGDEHGVRSTKYPKIFVVHGTRQHDAPALDGAVQKLEAAARSEDVSAIYQLLAASDIGYHCDKTSAAADAAKLEGDRTPTDWTH